MSGGNFMDKKYEKCLLILMVFAVLILCGLESSTAIQKTHNQFPGIVRFHVIANSDSSADQELKLQVRDYVLSHLQDELSKNISSRDEVSKYINDNMNKIEGWTKEALNLYESDYSYNVSLGVKHIPAKYYDDLYFPEGNYEALTVTIGEGKGKNWWCVVFPPLCLIDSSDNESNEEMLIDQEQKIILKSKIKELMNNQPVYSPTINSISETLLNMSQTMNIY